MSTEYVDKLSLKCFAFVVGFSGAVFNEVIDFFLKFLNLDAILKPLPWQFCNFTCEISRQTWKIICQVVLFL